MQAQKLWHTGLVALQHVRSSRTRDRTRVPCISKWILNHYAPREVFFELWFSQGICPVVGLLGHMVILFLDFKEPP